MVSPEGAYSGHRDLARAREEALEVLADVRQWRLAEASWQFIDQALVAMDAALVAGDPVALAAATSAIEIAGPVRVIKIGDPQVEPPPPVRDRMNRLVHLLDVAQDPATPQAGNVTSE